MTSRHSVVSKKIKTKEYTCLKLELPDNVVAYLENRELDRDITPIECSKETIENVCSNYLIIKNILSHLNWQDKLVCKHVCSLWHSVILTLQKEQLQPVDFSVNLSLKRSNKFSKAVVMLKKSEEFFTEPLAIFTLCNTVPLNVYTVWCDAILPTPCEPVCDKEHSILDLIYQRTTAPKDCMYAMKTCSVSYLPLPSSPTYVNMLRKPLGGSNAFFCGLYIPKIPGVVFKTLNLKNSESIQQELKVEIKKLTDKYIVKGVVACLTDNYLLYADQDNIESLEFLRTMQPDIPFAFGGCLLEDTISTAPDLAGVVDSVNKGREFISGNLMSIGMFLIPRDVEPTYNFEVYSLVMESTEWTTAQIQQAIQEFSQKVPQFEHSVALKLSCLGREKKHESEQHQFRKCFPRTRQAGCFGNGELGVNYPRRNSSTDGKKRPRDDISYAKVHSYSTIYIYICWGKILAEPVEKTA